MCMMIPNLSIHTKNILCDAKTLGMHESKFSFGPLKHFELGQNFLDPEV